MPDPTEIEIRKATRAARFSAVSAVIAALFAAGGAVGGAVYTANKQVEASDNVVRQVHETFANQRAAALEALRRDYYIKFLDGTEKFHNLPTPEDSDESELRSHEASALIVATKPVQTDVYDIYLVLTNPEAYFTGKKKPKDSDEAKEYIALRARFLKHAAEELK